MRRFLLMVAMMVVLVLPASVSPGPASAEAGCGVSAWTQNGGTQGVGSYLCATDDNGNRQIQVCLQEYWSYATYGCRTYNVWTYGATVTSYSVSCTFATQTRRAWVWFLGEDGSQTVRAGGWINCTTPVMG